MSETQTVKLPDINQIRQTFRDTSQLEVEIEKQQEIPSPLKYDGSSHSLGTGSNKDKKFDTESVASPVRVQNPITEQPSVTKSQWKQSWSTFLDNKYYTIFMAIITIYALFGDDIRLMATSKPADPYFYIGTIACLLFFSLEIAIASIVKEEYFMGFYFWLDTMASISLIADIGWIWDYIVGTEDFNAENAQAASSLARAGRGARIGTRAGRIVRIIRLIRLIRIVKLYKHAQQVLEAKVQGKGGFKLQKMDEEEEIKVPEESRVGKKLSDLTTRRVILIVLAMMFSVPVFTISTYKDENNSFTFGLQLIGQFDHITEPIPFQAAFDSYYNEHLSIRTPIILINCFDNPDYIKESNDITVNDLRSNEKEIASYNDGDYLAIFDLRSNSQLTAGLGVVRTLFVCFVLAMGALLFSKDANDLVIAPIEAMIQKVDRIAKNPLEAAQEEENEALAMEQAMENKKKSKKEQPYETVILEQTIIKIGALLALGFGEAGAKIIADNMAKSGDVDPMIPGNKIVAIFGFCDIRNFTDTTEVLQEQVMLFVNECAEIVHGCTDQFSGAANKNIGDAFLLVWKYPEEECEYLNDNLFVQKSQRVSCIADMSVLAFVKIIAGIKKSYKLDKYKRNKLLNERMPNYSVKLGYGLHVGWAIEGAIGSEFKIDASYLSPHVNMAGRLEAATKAFGVPLLISGDLYNICTPQTQEFLRLIDQVTMKGSDEKIKLFTFDVDQTKITIYRPEHKTMTRQQKKILKVKARLERNFYKKNALADQFSVSSTFHDDQDIQLMRSTLSKEFFDTFKIGFAFYIKGDWGQAKLHFEKVEVRQFIQNAKKQPDYPTRSLLSVMADTNFSPPPLWNGYREMIEK